MSYTREKGKQLLLERVLKREPTLDPDSSIVKIVKLHRKLCGVEGCKVFPYPVESEAWSYTYKVYHKLNSKEKKKPTKQNYYTYLKSSKWKKLRVKFIYYKGGKCEKCGCRSDLQVHHKTYKRLFNERFKDLILLCGNCHKKEHSIIETEEDIMRKISEWCR